MATGPRRIYTLSFLFLMEVIQRLGTDKALGLLTEAAKKHAEILEKEFGAAHGLGTPLEKGAYVYRAFMKDLGTETQVVRESIDGVDVRSRSCPIYGAFLDIGVECDFWMKGLCTNIVLPSIEAALKRFDERLTLTLLKHRSSAEDECVVTIRAHGTR